MKTILGMFPVGVCVALLPSPLDLLVFGTLVVGLGAVLWLSVMRAFRFFHNPEI